MAAKAPQLSVTPATARNTVSGIAPIPDSPRSPTRKQSVGLLARRPSTARRAARQAQRRGYASEVLSLDSCFQARSPGSQGPVSPPGPAGAGLLTFTSLVDSVPVSPVCTPAGDGPLAPVARAPPPKSPRTAADAAAVTVNVPAAVGDAQAQLRFPHVSAGETTFALLRTLVEGYLGRPVPAEDWDIVFAGVPQPAARSLAAAGATGEVDMWVTPRLPRHDGELLSPRARIPGWTASSVDSGSDPPSPRSVRQPAAPAPAPAPAAPAPARAAKYDQCTVCVISAAEGRAYYLPNVWPATTTVAQLLELLRAERAARGGGAGERLVVEARGGRQLRPEQTVAEAGVSGSSAPLRLRVMPAVAPARVADPVLEAAPKRASADPLWSAAVAAAEPEPLYPPRDAVWGSRPKDDATAAPLTLRSPPKPEQPAEAKPASPSRVCAAEEMLELLTEERMRAARLVYGAPTDVDRSHGMPASPPSRTAAILGDDPFSATERRMEAARRTDLLRQGGRRYKAIVPGRGLVESAGADEVAAVRVALPSPRRSPFGEAAHVQSVPRARPAAGVWR
eukprot:TRINITY_DN5898_c0_g1_i1.p1 TRINITY_DN5898_c0_g1~~TRINITY_DN5898_c0_g1_i1.p1  ORF type:complete len:606 (+),score=210.63 TRINITY_DN5898_c0_g1_i1:124-1818(+)